MNRNFVYAGPVTTVDTADGAVTLHSGRTYALDDGHPVVASMIARKLLTAAPMAKKSSRKGKS